MRTSEPPCFRAAAATRANSLSCSSSRRRACGCSRISDRKSEPGSGAATASDDDTRLASNHDPFDVEVVVEHDDVGRETDVEATCFFEPECARGNGRGCGKRLLDRDAEHVEVPNRFDHRQQAPREHSLGRANCSILDLQRHGAQAVRAPGHARRRNGVRDERDAPGRRTPDDGRRRRREMNPVEDDLDGHVIARERSADDARVAMVERTHRVEEVRDHAGAAIECGVRLLGRRVTVAARHGDAAGDEDVDQLERAGQLRREGHHPHGPRVEQALEESSVGIAPPGRRMGSEPARGEEGTLEVDADDPRPVQLGGNLGERRHELVFLRGDQRRQVRGDARLEQRLAGAAIAVGARIEEVDAAEAVHLHVEESRRGNSAAVPSAQAEGGDAPVDDLDLPRHEPAVDEGGFDLELHGISASRMLPPAAVSFARAVSASVPARSATIATFASPPACASACSTASADAPVASSTIRRTRPRSFSFAGETSTIRFPYVLPRRIIATVESVLSTSFCAVPAFRRVEPASSSGPTTIVIARSQSAASSESGAETTQAVNARAAAAARAAPRTNGVRPPALTRTTTSSARTSRAAASRPAPSSSSAASALAATASTASLENVARHSAASASARRPEVPAPTRTSRPPRPRRSTVSSTTAATSLRAAATAAGTAASSRFISSTSSRVVRRSRSAASAPRASVTGSSRSICPSLRAGPQAGQYHSRESAPDGLSFRQVGYTILPMAAITLTNLTKRFAGDVVAVDDVSLEIHDGEFMVLVGPSGCGKSTLLRILAGLEEATEGSVAIGERDVSDLAPRHRDIAMVFQAYALYPHMTVRQNLGYGLKIRRTPKEETKRRVEDVAVLLGLNELLERRPAQLSGGQRQRVAMGRAIAREPKAFLMDEPLSNLDAKLRVGMRASLQQLHSRLGVTTVYVTHDQIEAMTLGQRVAVMREGRILQAAEPQKLYQEPRDLFVAAFIGSPAMNLVEATIDGG